MRIDYHKRPARKHFKQTLNAETQKAIKALIITLSLMIITLGVSFLAITNQSAQKGYALQQAKLKNEQLKDTNSTLTNKITQATAYQRLGEKEVVEVMSEPNEKNYVTKEDNSVY